MHPGETGACKYSRIASELFTSNFTSEIKIKPRFTRAIHQERESLGRAPHMHLFGGSPRAFCPLHSARAQRIVLLRSVFMERDSAVARRCPERLSWSGARNTQFYTLRFDLSDVVMGKFSSDTYFTSRLRLTRSEHVAYLSGLPKNLQSRL